MITRSIRLLCFNRNSLLNLLFICSVAMFFMVFTSDAFASSATADPIGDVFCRMIDIFRGNTARGIAIIGVVVLGIQTLRGQLKWEVALVIVAGVIILFKAPDIIDMVAGTATASEKCVTTT